MHIWCLIESEKLVKVIGFEFLMEARTQAKVFSGVMLSRLVKRRPSFEELGACLFLQTMLLIGDPPSLIHTNM